VDARKMTAASFRGAEAVHYRRSKRVV